MNPSSSVLESTTPPVPRLEAEEELSLKVRLEELLAENAALRLRLEAVEKIEQSSTRERDILDALMESIPDHLYFKDLQSRFVRCGQSMARLFHLESPADLIGKSDFDFFTPAHAQPAFDDEQRIIQTGLPMVGQVEKEVWPNGNQTWVISTKMPWRDKSGTIIGTFGISKDITLQKKAELELEQVHGQLVLASRQAGMAEVATNVLHNIGNVLNSVNVSVTLLSEKIRHLKVAQLAKLADLVNAHAHEAGYLSSDEKGRQIPAYLKTLSEHMASEQEQSMAELVQLRQRVDHIAGIVAMQQTYAQMAAVTEKVKLTEIVENALQLNIGSLTRHDVLLVREFLDDSELLVDKHKVLQILVNLIRNAKYACDESGRSLKQLTIRTERLGEDRVVIKVIDNGIGIPAENMTRIFNHGFSTRKGGHGYGLHGSANTAKELGGSLIAQSHGLGTGAIFTLELPIQAAATQRS